MSLKTTCDNCGKTYSVNESFAGQSLKCKECGDVFDVPEDDGDEFDAAPRSRSRRSAEERPARRKPAPSRGSMNRGRGKKRAGLPKWVIPVIAGVAGVLVLGGVIWAVTSMMGNSHERLAKGLVDAMNDLAEVMEGIQDVSSAEAAAPKIRKIGDRMAELTLDAEELRKNSPLSKEEDKALEEKYKPLITNAMDRMNKQIRRLRDKPELMAVLQESLKDMKDKVDESRNAARKQQMADFQKRIDDAKAKAQERMEADRAARQNSEQNNPSQRPPHQPPFGPQGANGFGTPPQGKNFLAVEMPNTANFDQIRQRLREMSGKPQHFHSRSTSSGQVVLISPVPDVQRFADAIDFGQVTKADPTKRIINVQPDETYQFRPGGKLGVDQ